MAPEPPRTHGDLLQLSRQELVELWYTLPAPPFTELDGEYPIFLQRSRSDKALNRFYDQHQWNVNNPRNGPSGGRLLCRVCKPLGAVTGEGWSTWEMPGGHIERRFRFGTHMGMSVQDGRPCFVMNYAAFQCHASGQADVREEVRKVAGGLYVGVGSFALAAGNDDSPIRDRVSTLIAIHSMEHNGHEPYWKRSPAKSGVFILRGPTAPAGDGVDDTDAEPPY